MTITFGIHYNVLTFTPENIGGNDGDDYEDAYSAEPITRVEGPYLTQAAALADRPADSDGDKWDTVEYMDLEEDQKTDALSNITLRYQAAASNARLATRRTVTI